MKKTFDLWSKIFQVKQFNAKEDLYFITADEIKEISRCEPRIMAKMDSTNDLPPVFKKYGYFLLPVTNGKYAIVRGNGFHSLEKKTKLSEDFISRIKFPLTTAGRGSSEMQYLDYSFNSGAIEDILEIGPLYQSIRGREYTKAFSFAVNNIEINTSSVQIEVDSGLEGEDAIVLFEAKVGDPEDFIIRQLFYPYNHFRIVSSEKKIIPVFFTYDRVNQIYNYWIYEFSNPRDYNSIRFKKNISFKIIRRKEFELSDIKSKDIVSNKTLIPQANDLNKVIELAFKVHEGINNYKSIAEYFGFNERQSSYYREAAEALKIVYSKNNVYYLTDLGEKLVNLPVEKRNLFMVEILSDFDLIKFGLERINAGRPVDKSDLEKMIAKKSNLSANTVERRVASLIAWYKWISNSTGIYKWDGAKFVSN